MTWRQCNVKRDHLHQNTHENIWLLCAFYEFLHRYRWHLHMSDIFLRNILNNSYYTPSITYWMLQQTFTTVERVHSFLARLNSISRSNTKVKVTRSNLLILPKTPKPQNPEFLLKSELKLWLWKMHLFYIIEFINFSKALSTVLFFELFTVKLSLILCDWNK